MSLQKLKRQALAKPEVKAEYQQLEAEFDVIEQELSMPPQVVDQSTLGKNTNSKE